MAAEKAKLFASLEADLNAIGECISAKKTADCHGRLNALSRRFATALGASVEDQESWISFSPGPPLAARYFRVPLNLVAYKILVSCAQTCSLNELGELLESYLKWREWILENAEKSYAKLTAIDANVFVESWNFLSRMRDDSAQDEALVYETTLKVFKVLRTSAEFANRVEHYWKNAMRVVQRSREPFAFFRDVDLLSQDVNAIIIKNASLAKANSYFRCLLTYTQAAARENKFGEAERALNLHASTLKHVAASQLHSTHLLLEESSLATSRLLFHWLAWAAKPSDTTFLTRLHSSLQLALSALSPLTSQKASLNLVEKANYTDEYYVASKLLTQLKEWPDIIMRLRTLSSKLPSEIKLKLRELLKDYATLYQKCAKEEQPLPSNLQTFRQPQCVSIALGSAALLSVDLGDMDSAMTYFEKAESTIRSTSSMAALRQLYQQLHLAVGFVADSPSRLPYAISWMKQSCQFHQEYMDLFPTEKSNELATKLGFLASLESRSPSASRPNGRTASSNTTQPKSASTPTEPHSEQTVSLANPVQALHVILQTQWLPTNVYSLVDLHVKRQLQANGANEASIQLFFDLYSSRISDDRLSDFFKLTNFEATHYLYNGKFDTHSRLIHAALDSGKFPSSSLERAQLLIARVLGNRRKPSNPPPSSLKPTASDDNQATQPNATSSLIVQGLNDASALLEDLIGDEPTPINSRVMSELALTQCIRSICALESPASTSLFLGNQFENLDKLLDVTIQLFGTILSRMLAVGIGDDSSNASASKALLDQNRSHWNSMDMAYEHLMLLRDVLHFVGDQRRYIAVSKLVLKFLATLIPFGYEHGEHARMLIYSQIGFAFHELGYDDPLATKYFSKSGASDERELVDRLLQTDPSLNAEIGVWLSNSLYFLHDLGKLPEFDYIGHLETVSESLDEEMSTDAPISPSRFKFLQQVRATVKYTLAHLKSTSGRIDEAIIDALVAFRLRSPSAPKLPSPPAGSTSHGQKPAAAAPSYWKTTSWRFLKQYMESMDQLGRLYARQGSVAEARYYYTSALSMSKKYAVESSQLHFTVQIAQLDLESCNRESSLLPETPDSSPPPTSPSLTLATASALVVKGNSSLRNENFEEALGSYHEAENLLLALIDATYVQQLDSLEDGPQGDSGSTTKTKAGTRGRAKKTATAQTPLYRFSMSPAKLPKVRTGLLPSDYIGLKSTHLRILAKIASVDYHKSISSPDAATLLESASTKLANVKKQLEDLESCPSVQLDLALVMLSQAQVMIAQTKLENGINAWESSTAPHAPPPASNTGSKSRSTKSASKSKQVAVDKLVLAREILSAALALSVSAGSVPKVSSDICQYYVEVSGIIDPWLTIAKQNCSIGITLRHQVLENIYRLGIRKPEPQEEDESSPSNTEIDELAEEMNRKVALNANDEDEEEAYEAMLTEMLGELDFTDDQMDGEAFKQTFVDILGTSEETQQYTICTVSMGPDGKSLVVSRLCYDESEPLLCRINVQHSIDNCTEKVFAKQRMAADDDNEENDDDQQVSASLMRSATALIAPLLPSSNSTSTGSAPNKASLKGSASSTTSLQSTSSERRTTTAKTTSASRAKRSTSTSATTKKSSLSKSSSRTITSVDEIGAKELDDMLTSITISANEPEQDSDASDAATASLSSSTSSSSSSSRLEEESVFRRFQREFNAIIEDSKATAVTSESKATESNSKDFAQRWWSQRYSLDDRLNQWLSNFEDCILSPYKALFLGKLTDSKLEASLISGLDSLRHQVERILAVPTGTIDASYFKALVLGSDASSQRDINESLCALVRWQRDKLSPSSLQALSKASLLIQDTFTNASSGPDNVAHRTDQSQATSALLQDFNGVQSENVADEVENGIRKDTMRRQLRHPVIFILDKHLHALPWESLPVMRPNPVTRLPSIFSLRTAIMSNLQSNSLPNVLRDGIDAQKLFYILNPSQDLKSSQETLQPLLQDSEKKWNGIVGEKPTIVDYAKALERSNLLVYAGHNSGVQYLNGEASELRKVRTRAGGCAVWMMGCSSALLKDQNDFEPTGMALNFLLGGSPSVVGNLWDVTTRDLDKVTISMLSWLTDNDATTTLPEAILRARRECKLEFINAAALISYGLPLRVKRASSAAASKLPKRGAKVSVITVEEDETKLGPSKPAPRARRVK